MYPLFFGVFGFFGAGDGNATAVLTAFFDLTCLYALPAIGLSSDFFGGVYGITMLFLELLPL
jgi:Flp pilus assembly protein protease CpaA